MNEKVLLLKKLRLTDRRHISAQLVRDSAGPAIVGTPAEGTFNKYQVRPSLDTDRLQYIQSYASETTPANTK